MCARAPQGRGLCAAALTPEGRSVEVASSFVRRRVVLLLVLAACASQQAEVIPSPAPTSSAPDSVREDDDLAQAWASPTEAQEKKARVVPPPRLPDPRQPFQDALAEAKGHFAAGRLDAASKGAAAAAALAERTGGEERFQAGELGFKVAFAQAQPGPAREAAHRWRASCGPEKADACRAAAVRALASVERLPDADAKALKKEADTLERADECLHQSERAARPLPCFGEAERVASTSRDGLLLVRAALVKALAEKNDARRYALLERAVGRCDRVQCAAVRRKALGALVTRDLADKNLDAALKHALLDLTLHVETLPELARAWGRTAELDRVCAQYDGKNGTGACRKAEKEATGTLTFRDFSTQSAGQGLSAQVVREVNEHYGPSLQECLAEEARRLVPPDAVRYEVRWTVFNDGRVGEVHLRRDLDQIPLAGCLRTKFVLWRYPRYEGEWQNVEQSFTVTAIERRSMR